MKESQGRDKSPHVMRHYSQVPPQAPPMSSTPASPGVVCPVNARGFVIRPKVGFVQDECVEFPLPPRGVVHLSKVAFRDDEFPAVETGVVNI